MKENKDCKVVQDLLPNYIEHLTSEETNQFIEEHLKNCEECQAMLDSMKQEIKVEITQKDSREVEYIKKFNVKFKKAEYKFFVLIYTIIVILIVGVLAYFGRKYIILKDLFNKLGQYEELDNYYVKVVDYAGGGSAVMEYWVKDKNVRRCTSFNGIKEWQEILKDGKIYGYYQDELYHEEIMEGNEYDDMAFFSRSLKWLQEQFNNPKAIFTYSIETLKLNDKICYKIKANDSAGSYNYYEKETGLPVKSEYWEIGELAGETKLRSNVRSYEFKFNCVKDRHLEFDDGKEYEFEEVTKTAEFEETASISDGNLNIEISNLKYDEPKDCFSTDIKFSTVDNKGLSSEIIYDYIIYDANINIVASSIPIGMTPEKDRIAEKFARKYYANADDGGFLSHMIGVAEQRTNMSVEGIVHQTLTVPGLDEKLNLENLTIFITNVRYKNKGEPEIIEPEKDYIFTFN